MALLEVQDLRVTYGGVVAVDGVSFSVEPGSIVGLIGPNGAGKTSLIDALTGYHRPSAGRVVFAGDDVTSVKADRRSRLGLARTFQSVELFDDLTVEENLLVAAEQVGLLQPLRDMFLPHRPRGAEAVGWATSLLNLNSLSGRMPTDLSHGQRKLVSVGRALAQRPRLVLLDEPAAGLDSRESLELGQELRNLPDNDVSVLLVDHDMGLVLGVCDHVLVLDFGRIIAAGSPDEIRANATVIEAYLGSGGSEESHG
ncbi:ABC transporter ATP-binding protein [Angustibacter luteus]|uniref:ABC transporter ATP-binding protein n=1 Tax=Angustibacter luteus TaxID=658456 RepID=A0ABW1JDN7_9ACTN